MDSNGETACICQSTSSCNKKHWRKWNSCNGFWLEWKGNQGFTDDLADINIIPLKTARWALESVEPWWGNNKLAWIQKLFFWFLSCKSWRWIDWNSRYCFISGTNQMKAHLSQSEVEKHFKDFYQIHTYSNCQCPDGSWTSSQETVTKLQVNLQLVETIFQSESAFVIFHSQWWIWHQIIIWIRRVSF